MSEKVAIIGAGPAGVSAAIYLKRYGMEPIVYEKELVGGKVNKTERIDNIAGILSVKGPDLGMKLEDQLSSFQIKVIYREVTSLEREEDGFFLVRTKKTEDRYRYVILANGLGEKPFPIEGEDSFHKKGISRCAICDGAFYKGKDVAVIGAGNSAFEEAAYLAEICNSVTLIARRTTFRADEASIQSFTSKPNAKVLAPYLSVSCSGSDSIESLTLKNVETGEEKTLPIQGLFLYIGEKACTEFIHIDGIEMPSGIPTTDPNRMTNIPNLYAIGDMRDTPLRQVITAANDGAIAASAIHSAYLNESTK